MVEVRFGAAHQQGGETIKVVVGAGDTQREPRHVGNQSKDILRVGAVFAKQPSEVDEAYVHDIL